MAHLKFLLAFCALPICASGVAGGYYYWTKYAKPEISVTRQITGEGAAKRQKPDLGKRHFDAAMALLTEGELVSGRDRLLYLIQYYPESKTFSDAKRVAGEVNLDLLISQIPHPEKTRHVVRRGEALITIARRSNTTIDYIMRANGKTTVLIYPNEELIVYPLNYRVEISFEAGTLTVFDGKNFFKEYKIVNVNLPPEVAGTVVTTISEKVAWDVDRPVSFTDANYLNCSKWIRTGKIGLCIREYCLERTSAGAAPLGVMVEKSDMEELFTILRVGIEVKLVN